MIYLYALQGLGDIEAWLAGNASASRPQSWSGSVAQALSLTGLDPVSSFREACEPLCRITGSWPRQPAGLAMHFPCPVASDARDDAICAAHASGFAAALTLLESDYAFACHEEPAVMVGNLLFARSLDPADNILTATIMGWSNTDLGAWVWLDLWRLIEWLPEVEMALVRAMDEKLAQTGLALQWLNPQRALVRAIDS